MLRLRRKPKISDPWSYESPLITIGQDDGFTVGNAYENIAIFGGVGSGKTSGSAYHLSLAMLQAGFGGLVLTAKQGEAQRWRRLAELAGRGQDLIVVADNGEQQFNFLDYQFELQGRSGAAIENLVVTLDALMQVAERATGMKPGRGQESFWEQGIRKYARAVISLVVFATEGITVAHMLEVMRSVPRSLAQAQDAKWQKQSLVCKLIAIARNRLVDESSRHDLEQVESFFLYEFPAIAERTRSVFEAGLFGILDLLSRGTLHWLFGRGTTVTPADCLAGKILVIDLPVATRQAIGLIAQTLFKLSFQQMSQQRPAGEDRPLFLMADEFQELVTVHDFRFASVSRESKVVNCFITQSIASLYSALGADESGKAAVDAILGLASLKVFHSNACPITNQWASELIGRRRTRLFSSSMNLEPRNPFSLFEPEQKYTTGMNESFEYAVMPHHFTRLQKGGPPHMQTEAILFGGGRRWHGSGETYIKTTFNQGF
ncbi:MAG: TraM recognition domain-containing protein [Pirellulales bacterium]|nr:TraM recognition domain-containing protein [Pirellulales bacterium]